MRRAPEAAALAAILGSLAIAIVLSGIVAFVALAIGCTVDDAPRPCERLPHLDTTGNTVWCDCTCSDDARFACPTGPAVPVCWSIDDASTSEESST